jgi:hypothetical protein
VTLSPKQVALQIANALPDDASLEDAQEFLWERQMAERGREDAAAGHFGVPSELASTPAAGVQWANVAIEDFRDTLRQWTSRDQPEELWSAVAGAVAQVAGNPATGHSLPEMGDSAILEVPAIHGLTALRVVYELTKGAPRILWVTNNVTCYRNVRPKSHGREDAG